MKYFTLDKMRGIKEILNKRKYTQRVGHEYSSPDVIFIRSEQEGGVVGFGDESRDVGKIVSTISCGQKLKS